MTIPKSIFEQLESRILLDAAPSPAIDVPEEAQGQEQLSVRADLYTAETETAGQSTVFEDMAAGQAEHVRQELVFVDPMIEGYEDLVDGLRSDDANFKVVILDNEYDGIKQITEYLLEYSDNGGGKVDAVHILSHGTDGSLGLGNTELSRYSLEHYSQDLQKWNEALNEDADILLYGCKVAETGVGISFVDDLAVLTGADVAASDDDTGHYDFGADWIFEYKTGQIETSVAFSSEACQSWDHVAAVAAGFTEYYIPGEASQLWDIFVDIDNDPVLKPDEASGGGLHTVISATATSDGTTLYYDHWEDGYDADQLNPGGTTEVVTLNKGDVHNFEGNNVPVDPRGADIYYDGRDRIYAAGGPASVIYAVWPESINTVYALSWEIYPTKPFQTTYTIPVGEDLDADKGYNDFANVYAMVQSTNDNNVVQIDTDGNGITDITTILHKGEVTQIYNVVSGAIITGTAPIQVQVIVGQGGDADHIGNPSEARGYSVVPNNLWDSEYYSPVGGFSGANNTDLYIHNPYDDPITIHYEDTVGSGSFKIAPHESVAYSDPAAAKRNVPVNSGVYLRSENGEKFWGIGSGDTEGLDYDWGFDLVPAYALTEEYYIGWAPGSSEGVPTVNGSPVFISSVNDNTVVFVDYGPTDGVVDSIYTIDRLESLKVFDPDSDNTGMHISATGPISVAWGEDAITAFVGSPYLDMGYTNLPLPPFLSRL
ncbi:DUF4347 domain-containing protein [Desulfobacterales bacterium HSG16]|nr:DUF4347 domain-containing protein [Desulfobacterales bacterium HSG16]